MENFYIGQDIVAIKDHSKGHFKEEDIFIIQDLIIECGCGLCINIGIINPNLNKNLGKLSRCTSCGCIFELKSDYIYYIASAFKPLDSLVNISELTEILEKPVELLFN